MTDKDHSFDTRAVHAGEHIPPGEYIPIATPIHVAACYLYQDPEQLYAVTMGERQCYVYTRYGNPTVGGMETAAADLEGTEAPAGCGSARAVVRADYAASGRRPGDVLATADNA